MIVTFWFLQKNIRIKKAIALNREEGFQLVLVFSCR